MAPHAEGGLVIGGREIIYESFDRKQSATLLGPEVTDVAIGFNDFTTDNAGRLWVGSLAFRVFANEDMRPGHPPTPRLRDPRLPRSARTHDDPSDAGASCPTLATRRDPRVSSSPRGSRVPSGAAPASVAPPGSAHARRHAEQEAETESSAHHGRTGGPKWATHPSSAGLGKGRRADCARR